jgi:predicted acyl esterase
MARYQRDAEEEAMREYHLKATVNEFEKVQKTRIINGEEVLCNFRKQPIEAGFTINYYAPFEPGTHLLEGKIIYERDVAVEMRDGRKLYVDIYRPKDETNIPAIVAYSPFGKRHWHGRGIAPGLQTAMGVPKTAISTMATFEAPDPGFWCHQGYAVVNVDVAGVGYSEGDYLGMCWQYGLDGYDTIEWLAKQKWCNGNVGMCGNSGLAIGQWFVAATCPPSLKCIAPWEGTADFYRESMFPGGIPYPVFASMIHLSLRGPGLIQDPAEDMKTHPLFDTYWEDYKAKVENIRIPVYATGSYMHSLHLRGAIHSFLNVRSRQKWMRLHRDFEWPDFNNPKYMSDLKLFFDRFLKNIHNGWEMTPRLRLGITDAYEYDYQVDRPENEFFPLERTQYTKFYLDARNGSLTLEQPQEEASVSYDAETGEANFDITFTQETEISGFHKLRLWVEADGNDEMDLFVHVKKLNANGEIPLRVFGENDPGAPGKMRVSHRELDPGKSTEYLPIQTHTSEQKLKPGEIVPVDIEIYVMARLWHAGETLRINIAPRMVRDETWFLPLVYDTNNKGRHIIHTGGKYDSYYYAPVIPPKYQYGDYVVR